MDTHFEGLAELVAHQIVEQRIDASGQIVEHTRNICHHRVEELMLIMELGAPRWRVNGNQTLRVKWCPAQKETDDDGNCETNR